MGPRLSLIFTHGICSICSAPLTPSCQLAWKTTTISSLGSEMASLMKTPAGAFAEAAATELLGPHPFFFVSPALSRHSANVTPQSKESVSERMPSLCFENPHFPIAACQNLAHHLRASQRLLILHAFSGKPRSFPCCLPFVVFVILVSRDCSHRTAVFPSPGTESAFLLSGCS